MLKVGGKRVEGEGEEEGEEEGEGEGEGEGLEKRGRRATTGINRFCDR